MIHDTAVVDKNAELGDNVDVGPYCVVEGKVRIGAGTRLISHVSVQGMTEIGQRCTLHPFSVVGGAPQDTTYKGEDTTCVMGDGNVIREYVTIHRGSAKFDGQDDGG